MFLKFTQIRLSQLFYLPFFFFVCLFDLFRLSKVAGAGHLSSINKDGVHMDSELLWRC